MLEETQLEAPPASPSASPSSRGRGLTGRAAWNFGDQALSSISNAGVVLVVAHVLGVNEFGQFAIGFTIVTLVLQLVRQLVSMPLVLTTSNLSAGPLRNQARLAVGASISLGAVLAMGIACMAPLFAKSMAGTLLGLAVALPGVFTQDTLRFAAFAAGRPSRAALSDAIWLVAVGASLAALAVSGRATPGMYMAAWGLSGTLAGIVAMWQSGVWPRLPGAMHWTWSHRKTSGLLFVEIAAAYGSAQIAVLMISGAVGPAAAGALRGAQTLLGPVNVVGMAAISFLIPELVRRPHLGRRGRMLAAAGVGGFIAFADLVLGITLLAVPSWVGEALLGSTWSGARQVLLPITLLTLSVALSLGPLAVLQSMGRVGAAALCSIGLFPVMLASTVVGLHVGGLTSAAYAMAAAQFAVLLAWWPTLLRYAGKTGTA